MVLRVSTEGVNIYFLRSHFFISGGRLHFHLCTSIDAIKSPPSLAMSFNVADLFNDTLCCSFPFSISDAFGVLEYPKLIFHGLDSVCGFQSPAITSNFWSL